MTGPLSESTEWALQHLENFIQMTTKQYRASPPNSIGFHAYHPASPEDEIIARWVVIDQILGAHLPDWADRVRPLDDDSYKRGYHWQRQREAAQQCLAKLQTSVEVARHLAPGPALAATSLHPWIWDAARSAWEASNFEDAVDAAARNLSSRLRAKVSRKDLAEGDLVAHVFSDKPGDDTNPRLRLPLPESLSDSTRRSIYGGIIAYGKGLFQTVRNPLAHEATPDVELSEGEALECLAAFSLLARWVDRATVQRS